MATEWFKPVDIDETVVEVGTVTVFINVPKGEEGSITDETLKSVERHVLEQFIAAAERRGVDMAEVRILDVETALGCITVVITVGVVVKVAITAGATVAAVATFLKHYKEMREGLILAVNDIKSVPMRVRGKESKQTASLYKETLEKPDSRQLNEDVDEAIEALKRRNDGKKD